MLRQVAFLLFLSSHALLAQSSSGTITGTITDSSGSVVGGAQLRPATWAVPAR